MTGRRIRLLLASLVLVASPSLAAAQTPGQDASSPEASAATTRAGALEAARRAKAEQLSPPRASRAEAAFLYVEETRLLGRLFNPPAGWFVQVGGLSEGSGLALGTAYRFPDGQGGALDLRGVGSIGGAWLADLSWRSDSGQDDRVALTANLALERHANQRFYGLGPETTKAYDSGFDLDERHAEGAVVVRLNRWMRAAAGGGLGRLEVTELDLDFDDDDDAAVASSDDLQVRQFREGLIPGLRDASTLLRTNVDLIVDTRGERGRAGARIDVRQAWYRAREHVLHDFAATRIDAQAFIPVWNGTRTFALRLAADRLDPADGHRVPFYLQPTVGGSRTLRAFDRQRFRDLSTLLLQAEYRYEINPFVSGAIFVETGQVAPDWKYLRADRFRGDYGIGLRAGYERVVVLRTDLAFGGEGPRLIIALNGVF